MRRTFLIAAVVLVAAGVGPSVASAAESSPESAHDLEAGASAFDFWIGEWDIRQQILKTDGSWHAFDAHTSVAPAIEGRALVEHWKGEVQFFWEGMTEPQTIEGLSVRAYDKKRGEWMIHWMDSRNPSFGNPYVGNFADGRGEFFREWSTPQGNRVGRIVFSDITPDSVRWELAVSSDDRKSWTTLWVMEMRRASGGPR
jgi:hypothetical protein